MATLPKASLLPSLRWILNSASFELLSLHVRLIFELEAATAFSDCLLLRLDQESFRDLLNDHSEIAWGVMQLLTQRLRNLMNQNSADEIGERTAEAAAG